MILGYVQYLPLTNKVNSTIKPQWRSMSPAEILNEPVSGRFLQKVTAYVLTDSQQNISK